VGAEQHHPENPVVDAPIVGATKPHHLPDAVAALDITLTEEEITAREEHYTYREPTCFDPPPSGRGASTAPRPTLDAESDTHGCMVR
jgi:hypothetical protein